jgi:hypothetical protein
MLLKSRVAYAHARMYLLTLPQRTHLRICAAIYRVSFDRKRCKFGNHLAQPIHLLKRDIRPTKRHDNAGLADGINPSTREERFTGASPAM